MWLALVYCMSLPGPLSLKKGDNGRVAADRKSISQFFKGGQLSAFIGSLLSEKRSVRVFKPVASVYAGLFK